MLSSAHPIALLLYVMLKMNNDDDPFNTVLVSTAEKGFGFLLQINGGWEQIRFGLK